MFMQADRNDLDADAIRSLIAIALDWLRVVDSGG
jgi:hypothetical protein